MVRDIKVNSSQDIMDIHRAAVEAPFSVWVHGEDLLLDAKSLMGLFMLSPEDTLKLVFPSEVDSRLLIRRLQKLFTH